MSISQFPPAATGGSPIASIQRGVTTTATTVSISAVDIAKSFVTSYSDASSGNVGMGGGANPAPSTVFFGTQWSARAFGAYLSSSTELVTTGPTRWEVIEFS